MRNVRAKRSETDVRRDAVEAFGMTFGRHGLSMTFGRVFGLLLISEEPLGLDDIARELDMSKSAASRTMRELETFGVARRASTRGSRRVVFEAAPDPVDGVVVAAIARLRDLSALFEATGNQLGDTKAGRRLATMAELYDDVWKETSNMLIRWRERHT